MSNAEHGKIIQRKWQERMQDDHMIECLWCCFNYDPFKFSECPKCYGLWECDHCGEIISEEDMVKGYHVRCGGSCEPCWEE